MGPAWWEGMEMLETFYVSHSNSRGFYRPELNLWNSVFYQVRDGL